MPLRICEGSHYKARTVGQSRVRELRRLSAVRLVSVPPFSVLAVNGKIIDAESAWRDANRACTCAADIVRYHSYFMKDEHISPDGIRDLSDFESRSLQPSSSSKEDLNPLVDAVRDESLAVQKAGTEGSAATRKLDKLNLGSHAALTQQIGRVHRTKQAACSSRKM